MGKSLKKRIGRPLERFLARWLDRRIERLLDEDGYNLRRALQRRAARESAEWIQEHVPLHLQVESRRDLLERAAASVTASTGLYLEFGVYSGATINLLASLHPEITFYGFDSFAGLSEPWIYRPAGAFGDLGSEPEVRANVTLVKGRFEDTLPAFVADHDEPIAFLHIDSDLYSSAMTVLELACPRLQPGSVVLFDEYFNYPGWREGEHKAWTESVERWGLEFEYLAFSWRHKRSSPGGQQLALRITGRNRDSA